MPMLQCTHLSYDLLAHIIGIVSSDYPSLYRCSLVNWEFNAVVSRVLYAQVQHLFTYQIALDSEGRSVIPPSMFASACAPHNAPFVQELEVTIGLPQTLPLTSISYTISNAIRMMVNLSSITLTTHFPYHESLFFEPLEALKHSPLLSEVTLNAACMGGLATSSLVQIKGLRRLKLSSPNRTVIDSLPDWLGRLSKSLIGFHLEDNCGSITPGVLTSFLPHVRGDLCEVTLGLSYSLTDEDVFSFLAQLPRLEHLRLQYYLQPRKPKTRPNLTMLKYFEVNHADMQTRYEAIALCKWIKVVISSSPIESLRLVCNSPNIGAIVSFSSIVDHLVKKHSKTLRIIDFRSAYIDVDAVKGLFSACLQLEEFHIAVRENTLDTFQEYSLRMERLHTASFEIRNKKSEKCAIDDALAIKIVSEGPPSLRRLAVNRIKWEGAWQSTKDGGVYFVVHNLSDIGSQRNK